jgi:hypothetical protein
MSTPESNVWDAPVNVEGVTGAPDPPASPSEPVATAPAAGQKSEGVQEGQQSQPQQPEPSAPVAAERLDWTTAPSAFREAHEAEKPLRELAREVGGLDTLREAVEFDNLIRNPSVDVSVKMEKLHAASEREFQRLGEAFITRNWQDPQWKDHLLMQDFGLTAADIVRLKGGQGQQPQQPQQQAPDALAYARELLNDPMASESDKALAQAVIAQAEAVAELPTLKKELGSLREKVQTGEQATTEQQRVAFVNDFTSQAFAPVEAILKEAFPAVPGESAEDKHRREYAMERVRKDVFDELYAEPLRNPSHPNHALAKEIEGYIQNLDRGNAQRRIPKLQALAEMAGERYASFLSASYAQKRQVQSRPLEREPNPPVVNGQGASFGNTDSIPSGPDAWNDPNMVQHWQEIGKQVTG